MTADVPTWIFDGGKSEKWCFLRLPEKMQRLYINIFWKVRIPGLSDLFYRRVATANYLYGGWRTDQGWACIVCGVPDEIRYVRSMRKEEGSDIQGHRLQIWYYYFGGSRMRIVFEWRYSEWRLSMDTSLHGLSNYTFLTKRNLKKFKPTEEGWEMIGNMALEWVRKKEKK